MTTPLETLRLELSTRHPTWRPHLSLAGEGLDFRVFHAIHPVWGDVSIKAPRTRFISNDNDDHIDARNLLRQEATLNAFFADHGIPTPRAFDLHVDGTATDYLIGAYVQHDQSTPSPRACGALLARMHAIAPPADLKCVAEIEDTLSKTIATLIVRRSRAVERLAGLALPVPSESQICDVLDKSHGHVSPAVLHMDFRPANVLARNGDIAGVIDWGNALVGDPALETARVAEYGLWDDDFGAGYGPDPLHQRPAPVALLYRLYTATMLAVVFLSRAPDPANAGNSVKRVQALYRSLSTSPSQMKASGSLDQEEALRRL
jgi:aminoglycoside phosphotransferase (APT) family kinase protein